MPTYRILFSGRVQGVGFRATCRERARQWPRLAGEVCNLSDGRVQLVVRGPAEDVAALVQGLRDDFAGCVEDVDQREVAPGDDSLPAGLAGVQVTRGQ